MVWIMHIDEIKWTIAHNYGKPKWHSFKTIFSWKGEILDLDTVSQKIVLYRKQTTEQKLLILV